MKGEWLEGGNGEKKVKGEWLEGGKGEEGNRKSEKRRHLAAGCQVESRQIAIGNSP